MDTLLVPLGGRLPRCLLHYKQQGEKYTMECFKYQQTTGHMPSDTFEVCGSGCSCSQIIERRRGCL